MQFFENTSSIQRRLAEQLIPWTSHLQLYLCGALDAQGKTPTNT